MKNLIKLFSLLTLAGFMLASCEGPIGPAGAAGANGADGADGADGQDGQDANESCTLCHKNDQDLTAKMAQWAVSTHATGGNAERNGYDCAPCHTSQGFLEVNAAGGFAQIGLPLAAGTIANPNQQNCYTCHDIHSTYTDVDWALTKTAATVGSHSIDGVTPTTVDLGTANMCTGCHQGRALTMEDENEVPQLVILDITDNVTEITADSYRWGLHHGPQYNVVVGEGLYEFGTGYPAGENHLLDANFGNLTNACVSCHMGEAYGVQAGGHTMNVGYEYHGSLLPNLPASCETCHVPDGGLDLGDVLADVQIEMAGLLDQLRVALETAGVKKPDVADDPLTPKDETAIYNYIMYTGSGATQVILPQTEMMLAAFTNFQVLTEDRSLGFHNPAYTRAILTNTIAAVNAAK